MASLDHPAVVPVYDAGENDGVLWMAMRLIAGGSLDDALVAGKRFTFEQVAAGARHIIGAHAVLRDPGLLASAVHRPRTEVFGVEAYPTLLGKAAALLHSLVTSAPPRDRALEATKARAKAAQRFGRDPGQPAASQ